MKYQVGDVIVNNDFEEPIYRKITEIRETGYTWVYPEVPDKEFFSENSSDPFFEWNWELINLQGNHTEKDEL